MQQLATEAGQCLHPRPSNEFGGVLHWMAMSVLTLYCRHQEAGCGILPSGGRRGLAGRCQAAICGCAEPAGGNHPRCQAQASPAGACLSHHPSPVVHLLLLFQFYHAWLIWKHACSVLELRKGCTPCCMSVGPPRLQCVAAWLHSNAC